jgi:lipoprotein-anchoring transpeptidase ErfK/SrfK
MKTALTILAASLPLALTPAAFAQGSVAQLPAADITASLDSGFKDRGRVYAVKGDRLVVRGRISPFVAGEKVLVELMRGSTVAQRKIVRAGSGGVFKAVVRPGRARAYAVRVRHKPSAKQAGGRSERLALTAITPKAHFGSSGTKVRVLQRALSRLAYVTHHGGSFDKATGRAVLSYRKVNHMRRLESANRTIYRRLFAGKGGYKLRYPNAGKHVEFDWSRQVLVLARDGKPDRIYHASSGKPSTPTVFGTFRFYRRLFGTNAKGMVHSVFFHGGYAIHGYHSVPDYAASHGCIRVPIPNAYSIYSWIDLGDTIFVYH